MQSSVSVIERIQTPRGELQLQQRGDHYEIISNGTFLMATYNGESEKLLVRAALDAVSFPKSVLVGGLGVGFSLAEALKDPSIEEVTVVEIEERIIDWNRNHLSAFSGHSLEDPRTHIIQADFLKWMKRGKGTYDTICLDIDNGPDWTVMDSNHDLYGKESLTQLINLLKPNGVISFWSASPAPTFYQLLKGIFNSVTTREIPQEKGEGDFIYLASSPRKNT